MIYHFAVSDYQDNLSFEDTKELEIKKEQSQINRKNKKNY